jgi:hypothetical protein
VIASRSPGTPKSGAQGVFVSRGHAPEEREGGIDLDLYELVIDISHETLVAKVNDHMKQGWQPAGGIAVAPEYVDGKPSGHMLFAQALVRRGHFNM